MLKKGPYILLAVLLVFLQACGGGGTASVPQVQKTANVVFATSTVDSANTHLRSVYIEAVLPEGVSVATNPGSTEIKSGVLVGVGTTAGQVFFGTYSAAIRKVKIPAISVSSADMSIGPFASLACDVMPGNTLNTSQFSSIVPTLLLLLRPLFRKYPSLLDINREMSNCMDCTQRLMLHTLFRSQL